MSMSMPVFHCQLDLFEDKTLKRQRGASAELIVLCWSRFDLGLKAFRTFNLNRAPKRF
jgi:hypothetical protein